MKPVTCMIHIFYTLSKRMCSMILPVVYVLRLRLPGSQTVQASVTELNYATYDAFYSHIDALIVR